MRRYRTWPPFALALLALACSDPTAAGPTALVGRWTTAAQSLSPSGWHQSHLTFTAGGTFVFESRMYGVYPGQPRDELSSYSRTQGSYWVEGDRLHLEPRRLVTWDRFYGADSPEHVEERYPYGTVFDGVTFSVAGPLLTLHYLTYPADAPVPTTAEFFRGP